MSIKESITIQDVCNLLNDLLEADPEAVKALVNAKVPCNETIANHAFVQVSLEKGGTTEVGLVGILNGFFGADTDSMGGLCYLIDEESGEITGFRPTFG